MGRVGLVELRSLSLTEIASLQTINKDQLNTLIFNGGYPALYDRLPAGALQPGHRYRDYVSTCVERDVRQGESSIETLGTRVMSRRGFSPKSG